MYVAQNNFFLYKLVFWDNFFAQISVFGTDILPKLELDLKMSIKKVEMDCTGTEGVK